MKTTTLLKLVALVSTINMSICVFFLLFNVVLIGSTTSMYPTLRDGDILVLFRWFNGDLTGKIVSYRNGSVAICHRVIEDHGDYVITQGDNSPWVDPWKVPKNEIIGVVVFILSTGKEGGIKSEGNIT